MINRNRLTWPRALCRRLSEEGLQVHVIDCQSTYPPLLEWYESEEFRDAKYRLNREPNHGRLAFWKSGLAAREPRADFFVVTDADLDLSQVPAGFVDVLARGLHLHPDVTKCGLSIETDDLPEDNVFRRYESVYWTPLESGYLDAPVDTTLAMYRRSKMNEASRWDEDLGMGARFYSAVRAPRPYTCRHLPWYAHEGAEGEEEEYYRSAPGTQGYITSKLS